MKDTRSPIIFIISIIAMIGVHPSELLILKDKKCSYLLVNKCFTVWHLDKPRTKNNFYTSFLLHFGLIQPKYNDC